MKIQSISISVPAPTKKGACVNNCKFCCSKTHSDSYENRLPLLDIKMSNTNLITKEKRIWIEDYANRLAAARDKGADTLIITGEIEPLQNKKFIEVFADINWNLLNGSFKNIELQTTGVFLDDKTLEWLRYEIGVTTISLSISNIWSNRKNFDIIGTPDKIKFQLDELTSKIKNYGFNLRLSVNMLKTYENSSILHFFKRCRDLKANQITLRRMWDSGKDSEEDNWVLNNRMSDEFFEEFENYIIEHGRKLHKLATGSEVYSLCGMSVVLDRDCMADGDIIDEDSIRYLILREDCRLYTHWDDVGSLWF